MAVRYRYSEWDGTQSIPDLEASEILDALSDDLMNFGDLQHALRNLMQRGMRSPQGDRMQGLRDLLQQLRQQRRQRLDQFDLGDLLDDIRQQLEEIIELERATIDERIGPPQDAASEPASAQAEQATPPGTEGMDGDDDAGGAAKGAQSGGQRSPGSQQAPMAGATPEGTSQRGPSGAPKQPGDPSQPTESGGAGQSEELSEEEQFQQMLERIAQRKRAALDELPPDPAGKMQALQNYEFLSPEAQHKFQELVEQLRQQMTKSLFNDIEKMVEEMSDGDMQRMKDMVRDLNEMLAQRMRGEEPDFDAFMQQYGDMFGENPPQSLDELLEQMQAQMQAMQSLMESMPSDQRQQLQSLMAGKFGDPELEAELSELAQNLDFLNPNSDQSQSYPFRGDEGIDFEAAMRLMDEMHNIDDLERDLERAQYTGELDQVDLDQLRELLGDDAVDTLDELKQLLEVLENAGYIRKDGEEWELTPRGTRMIGQNALEEIYRELKAQGIGSHPLPEVGRHGERLDDSKPYEFGDPFHLDMNRTIMNALEREGPGSPVNIEPSDFEIFRSEQVTQTATVLMVDLSWSMALRGSFQAAKKVALALQNLIKQQYPRDSLYVIGFSAKARELKAQDLPFVRWDESVLGTNMHHAFMLAEQLLAKHRVGSRQILMISDGEPTAHLENGRSQFAYPPSPVTIRETLKAVKRVTEQDITINTFMLDRNYYLKEFVNQLAKINGGRVFYSTPDKLGEYMLVDYVRHKRRKLTAR